MAKKFIKVIEDFVCEHCSKEVRGNGFTNHCPFCLWSKHVDLNPGDRAGKCRGGMKPTYCTVEKSQYMIVHTCVFCGFEKKNKVASNDSFEELLKIQKQYADKN